jgi:hypothetical protein
MTSNPIYVQDYLFIFFLFQVKCSQAGAINTALRREKRGTGSEASACSGTLQL